MNRLFSSLALRTCSVLLCLWTISLGETTPLLPTPTYGDVAYGDQPRQTLDFWQAKSSAPAPAVIYLHGGAWANGDKSDIRKRNFGKCLESGISVISINYRFVRMAQEAGVKPPVEWPMHDAVRALQFVRSKASAWNIDPTRIAMSGTSAGACTSLWIALHDDMAVPGSTDPIARQSTRLSCAAVYGAQTSLDPKQLREWTPNSNYGGHAFGFQGTRDEQFVEFIAKRDEILPWIHEYSPIEHASADDPPVFLLYDRAPDMGKVQKDPTHSANLGVGLRLRLDELGVPCEIAYPRSKGNRHAGMEEFLIEHLGPPGKAPVQGSRPLKVAIVGDSTMCEYAANRPDRGWGMFLKDAFRPGTVEVANFAKAGRSTKTFIKEKRWDKTLEWKPDFVFIQFGHNDSHEPDQPESADPTTEYPAFLRRYVEDCRKIGAYPVLITPMVRRNFHDDGTLEDDLMPYAKAMKAVAGEMKIPVIDLHASSFKLVESLGPKEAQKLANKPGDRTHFNEFGARSMLRLVLAEIPTASPELANLLTSLNLAQPSSQVFRRSTP